ncbi:MULTISPECIES: RHS repeat protein [unclassified Pseudoxanthomonas]|uniref:RHS repeat protein n=1 Tax=unclassified Pseudoxanthomonas TaxID=2645906 RepID=UPI00307727CF
MFKEAGKAWRFGKQVPLIARLTNHLVLLILLQLCFASSCVAQIINDLEPIEDYNKKIQSAQVVSPMSADSFGESVSLYDGSTSFNATDIDLPGNNGLPVRLSRYFKVFNRRKERALPGIADWELDTPRLYGEFYADKGWKTKSTSPYSRCSIPAIADAAAVINGVENAGTNHQIWHGYHMHMPGAGDQELLLNTEAKIPAVQDGVSYPWITRDFTRLGCLSATKNGYPGEGFVAITPDGTKYYFDHAVTHPIKGYKVMVQTIMNYIGRTRVHLMATRVEDRFGNWVKYNYTGDLLTSIESSDGRLISLNYADGRLASAVANGRTWTYSYEWSEAYPTPTGDYRLRSVQRPDASTWGYRVASGTLMPLREQPPDGGQNNNCRSEPDRMDGAFSLEVTAPWGASALFNFSHSRRYRAHTPIHPCDTPPGVPELIPYIPHFFDTYSLHKKTVTGPGLAPAIWDYSIGVGARGIYTSGTSSDPCPSCVPSKTTTVTAPDGVKTLYEYGIMYGLNEGRLLSTAVKDTAGVVQHVSAQAYVQDSEVASQKFPAQAGTTLLHLPNAMANLIRPIKATTQVREGVTYTRTVDSGCDGVLCFDAFARPTRETRFSPWYSRTDTTEYHHNLSKWVLSQASKTTNVNTGLISAEIVFDPGTALPLQQKRFGKLQQTLTYNANGTLATVKDGNNNITTLGVWKRGIPQLITYADTNTQSAVVDDDGWIRSVTDEIGAKTCYGYDVMGRLSRIDYPSETAGVCGGAWHPTVSTFEYRNIEEHGLPPGHWLQSQITGNGYKNTFYDALWRPVLVHAFDATNIPGTLSATRTTYNTSGRADFQSYPSSQLVPPLKGVWTIYDALGRVRSVSQDSEHGPLTTLTDYLANNQVRVTNPKNGQTTSSFQVFDQPSYDSPVMISHPEGAFTDISRDIFGKPTALIRRNADSSLSVTRRYIYAWDQTLCKDIEPETGASVYYNDGAGNLWWSANGLDLPSVGDCNFNEAGSRAVTHTYDARNRIKTLSFPDGVGNQTWDYTPDGLPTQITTYNSNGGDPVVNAYGYNKRRMLTSESVTQPGVYSWALNYGYDTHGALANLTYPSGMQVSFAPNALGQPTQAGSYASGVSYYPNGAIKQFTYGNGIVHTMTQNDRQLPLQVRSGNVTGYEYWYDDNGNPTHLHDLVQGSNYSRTLEYDGLDRLTGAGSASFGGDHWYRFTYDALDNLKSWKLAGVKDYANYYYEPATNRLLSIQNSANATVVGLSYGERGNLRNKNGQQYVFDFGNRLREATGKETYRYDGHGRRVQSSSHAQGNILSMYGQDGVLRRQANARLGKNTEFIQLGDSLVARVNVAVAPGVPALTAPGYSTQGSYTVQWSAVPSINRYELQEQANGGAWQAAYSGAAVSHAISGKASGVYGYRVRACNPTVCGGWSGIATVTVELPPSTVPTLSLPSSSYSGSYTASWSAVTGATSYQLEESANGAAWALAYNGAATSNAYSGKATGSYAYRVRACNPAGCTGYSGTASITVLYAPASAPSVSSPGLNNTGSYGISWSAVANATRYQLEESALGGGWITIYNSSGTSTSVGGKTAGNYAYRATACNAAGCGPVSATVTTSVVLPPTAAPSASVPASNMTGAYTVSWSTVGAATGYHVWERVNGGNWVSVHDAPATSMSVSGKANATYGYVARGCNAGGCGPWSAEASTVVNVPPAIPATPTGLSVSRFRDEELQTMVAHVNWSASYGATYYEVQEKKGTAAAVVFNNGPATSVRRTGVGTTAALTYWVRACSANGCSAWSAGVSP